MPLPDPAVTVEDLLAHRDWVKHLARRLVRDPNLADDVEQMTWTAAIEKPPRRKGDLRAWFGRVARRRLSDLRRGESRRAKREHAAPPGTPSPATDELLARAETRARVAQVVLELDEPYRSAILLRFFEGMPPRKIAARQSVPVSTVKTRLERGLARMRVRLQGEGDQHGAWRTALLPLAGLKPILPWLHGAGGVLVATSTVRNLALVGCLLLCAGVGYVGWQFVAEDSEPTVAEDLAVAPLERPVLRGARDAADAASAGGADRGADVAAAPESPPPGHVREGRGTPPGVVAGTVQDKEGRPLTQVTVILWDGPGRAIEERAYSDSEGSFRFVGLEAEKYVLSIHAGGAHVSRAVHPGGPYLHVTMKARAVALTTYGGRVQDGDPAPRGFVGGQVLDDEGVALAGATVALWSGRQAIGRASTDDRGAFAFPNVDAGWYVLYVDANGWQRVRHAVHPGRNLLGVTLDRGPTIRGIVVEEGTERPVPEIRVAATGKRNVVVRTEDDGTFLLGGLTAKEEWKVYVGDWTGEAEGEVAEYVPSHHGPLAGGGEDLRIEVRRGLAVEGSVRGPDGEPWTAGAKVRASPVARDGSVDYMGQRTRAATDQGRFRIPGLAPGRYDLTVEPNEEERDEALPPASVIRLEGILAGTSDIVVNLTRGQVLKGRLIDETGAPVTVRGWVWVSPSGTPAGAPGSIAATVLEGGRFQTSPLDPGPTYDIDAIGFEGYRRGALSGAHAGDSEVVVTLPRGFRLHGRVRIAPASASPIAGVPITAIAEGKRAPGRAYEPWEYVRTVTNGEGRFVLAGLRDVPYAVTAGGGPSGYVGQERKTGVRPSAGAIAVRIEKGVVLAGRLVGRDDEPWPPIIIQAHAVGRSATVRMATTRLQPDGRFAFVGVAEGRIRLAATIDGKYRVLGIFDAPAKDLEVAVPE